MVRGVKKSHLCSLNILLLWNIQEKQINVCVVTVFSCYDCGFISAKTNVPYFGIEFDILLILIIVFQLYAIIYTAHTYKINNESQAFAQILVIWRSFLSIDRNDLSCVMRALFKLLHIHTLCNQKIQKYRKKLIGVTALSIQFNMKHFL